MAQHSFWFVAVFTLALSSVASAQPTPAEEAAAQTVTPPEDRFVLWQDEELGAHIKPILWIAAGVVHYRPANDANSELANRLATLALGRFGFRGQLIEGVTFKAEIERNLGFSVARGGPTGTSVWEGTGSFSARESYLRLERWGASLAGGIVLDPASADYTSANVFDLFGMDPYVRESLLATGFSQGQGFVLRYSRWGATAGFSYTAGNPLVSTLSFPFGGNVTALGTLFSSPLRAMSNGIPGSNIQVQTFSPSLTYEHELFDIAAAAQIYRVDVDTQQDEDKRLQGHNYRATARVKPIGDMLFLYGTASYRRNQQLAIPDLETRLKPQFAGTVLAGGADFNYGRLSAGASYYWSKGELSPTNIIRTQILNVGVTWWLSPQMLAVGVRYALSRAESEGTDVQLTDTDSVLVSMRMMI